MGGGIPLPALDVKNTYTPHSALEEYAKVAQLKALQQQTEQQAAMAPLQQQQAQQQVTAGGQENQMRAMELQDQQALRQIAPQHVKKDESGKVTGYDWDGFFNDASNAGVSPKTLTALQQAQLTAREKALTLSKGEFDQEQDKNKHLYEMLEGLRGVKDPQMRQQQYQQALMSAARSKIDVGSLPPQAPNDEDLTAHEASLGMHAQTLADAKTQSETAKNLKGEVGQQELNAYLANSSLDAGKKKDAATFLAWKAKQSPQMIVMGNQLGGPGQGTALDQAAQRYSQTGELPAGFSRSPGTTSAIIKRAADLNPDANLAANKATFKADSAALSKLNTQFEMVSAFENTAIKNLDRLAQTAKSIPDLGARFANIPVRAITAQMIGTEAMSRLNADLLTARSESARVLNSANATGVLTNEARQEAEHVLDGSLPYPAMIGAIEELKNDMHNRHVAYQGDIDNLKHRIGTPGGSAQPSTSAAPAASGPPQGATHTAKGSDGKMHYTNAQGQDLGIVP